MTDIHAGRHESVLRRILLQPPLVLALEAGLLFALLVAGLSVPLLREGTRQAKQQFDHHLMELVSVMAARVDGDVHETLVTREQQSGETHARLQEVLVHFQNANPSVHALYTMRYRDGGLLLVLDAARSPICCVPPIRRVTSRRNWTSTSSRNPG